MKILVTGANGQLGNAMRRCAANSEHVFIFTDVNEQEGQDTVYLDITNLDAIRQIVAKEGVDAIVNCAAWTNVDACETNPELAELADRLNAEAPRLLAMAMKEVDGLLVHISTDYVFGAEPYNTPCKEEQRGTPTGVYGRTKLHGEENIIATGVKHIILRTAWLYSEDGKNFVKTMLMLTDTKPSLNVVFDQCGTPTYAGDLAEAILTVLNDYAAQPSDFSHGGVYHFSNEGVCSWYDFTIRIAQLAGHTSCNILPCHSEEFPSPVKRPAYSVLDKTKFKRTFGVTIPYWTDSLELCLKNLKNQQ
ncbi:MAG: dTDP-4-dehydrorhamnose reductase [Bacteroidales bacterium]|nr:dTDP-4-dehydrorhamnose reductase [Candidatus Physcousia equi]